MDAPEHLFDDRTPGVEEHEPTASYQSYTVGLGLAILAMSWLRFLWTPHCPTEPRRNEPHERHFA